MNHETRILDRTAKAICRTYCRLGNGTLLAKEAGYKDSPSLVNQASKLKRELSAEIVARSSIPVFLAGGLGTDNVKSAIEKVSPFGIDLCSKVRTNNRLDEQKLKLLMRKVSKNQ